MQSYDIVISGGGLVGSVMAVACARLGLRTLVLERMSKQQAEQITMQDGRASAIAESSVRLLKGLNLWEQLVAHAQPILDIRVVEGYSHAYVHYDHKESPNACPFGYILPNNILRPMLMASAAAHKDVRFIYESELASLEQHQTHVELSLRDGTIVRAPLLMAADGRQSTTRTMAGITSRATGYGQDAIVTAITHTIPHAGVALERFLPAGPFAQLPMPDNAQGQHRSGIVWSEPHHAAQALLQGDATLLREALHVRLGNYLGDIALCAPCIAYPLSLVQADALVKGRVALIGDAAHAIHPIAGQGVNVGYRDVAFMASLLEQQLALGLDIGDAMMLARYAARRTTDITSMMAATDGLNRLFSNNAPPLRLARKMGLSMVERAPTLKRYFMRRAMGLSGVLPPLLQDSVKQEGVKQDDVFYMSIEG